MAALKFFTVAFGLLFLLGLTVAFVASKKEKKKSERIKLEFLKQFE